MALDQISNEQPRPGQTLMSFVARSAIDCGLGWSSFQRIALKCTITNVRAAERRLFDWSHLSTLLGPQTNEIFAMSERREITTIDDYRSVHWSTLLQRPWMCEKGYSAYDPVMLRSELFLRTAWLRPSALVNLEAETLMLFHCHRCGIELRDADWQFALPNCPVCDEPLGEAPIVKAPPRLVQFAKPFTRLVDRVYGSRLTREPSADAERVAGLYLCARLLRENERFRALFSLIANQTDLGPLDFSPNVSADRKAVLKVQSMAAADHIWLHVPLAFNRFRILRRHTLGWVRSSDLVERGLAHAAAEIGAAVR